MARKKKSKRDSEASNKPQTVQFRPLQGALEQLRESLEARVSAEQAGQEKRAKSAASARSQRKAHAPTKKKIDQKTYDERMALQRAYQGVKPLHADGTSAARAPKIPGVEPQHAGVRDEAFRPVAQMVAEGVRFVIEEDEIGVRAYRASRGKQALESLKSGRANPEASLDLHGFREEPARQMLQRWLRSERERGRYVLLVVHGQGHHSAGSAVIREAVHDELRRGISAAFVDAFVTAAQKHGGKGATLVALRRR